MQIDHYKVPPRWRFEKPWPCSATTKQSLCVRISITNVHSCNEGMRLLHSKMIKVSIGLLTGVQRPRLGTRAPDRGRPCGKHNQSLSDNIECQACGEGASGWFLRISIEMAVFVVPFSIEKSGHSNRNSHTCTQAQCDARRPRLRTPTIS